MTAGGHVHVWHPVSLQGQRSRVLEGCASCPATRIVSTSFPDTICIRGQCPGCRRTVDLAHHDCPGPRAR